MADLKKERGYREETPRPFSGSIFTASAYDKSAVICRAELPLQLQQRRF
jgi:hypothetical protein